MNWTRVSDMQIKIWMELLVCEVPVASAPYGNSVRTLLSLVVGQY
jgi:hypothetical protein